MGKNFLWVSKKNDLYVFSGLISLKGKNRFPIPIGDRSLLLRRLTCDLQGRIAKFYHLKLSGEEMYMNLLLDFMELLRAGYSVVFIHICWGRACPDFTTKK